MNLKLKKITLVLLILFIRVGTQFAQEDKIIDLSNFHGTQYLDSFYSKLEDLEKNKSKKLNIVHIGDSHIQADFFTNKIREVLQNKFGNAGLGFTFPYKLIRTNGPRNVKYMSSAAWQGHYNIKKLQSPYLGLSGIGLSTKSKDFIIQATVEDKYAFSTVKLIYPYEKPVFKISDSKEFSELLKNLPKTIGRKYHKIKSGESLSVIARRYRVTIAQLKKANGLTSSNIRAGKTLVIPTNVPQIDLSQIRLGDSISYFPLKYQKYASAYFGKELLNSFVVVPDKSSAIDTYALNGIVLENDSSGIIYHSIGVNGAKYSDYNKYPLFFEQLPLLEADLIILSFGTNEAYGRLATASFIDEMESFISNVRKYIKNTPILVMTPPPSMLRGRKRNTVVENYVQEIILHKGIAVWDIFSKMGGLKGIEYKGAFSTLINRDRVHYSEMGYSLQGDMFIEDFLGAYQIYKVKDNNAK